MSQEKIWLTGTSGMVGRSIYERLTNAGLDVLAVTNQEVLNYSEFAPGSPAVPADRAFVDFSKSSDIEQLVKENGVPETLIHVGWGAMAEPDSEFHLNENVETATTLMQTLYGLGLKKFIFLGTILEYGQGTGPFTEDTQSTGQMRNYEIGKAKVREIGLAESKQRGTIYIHVRVSYTFGAPQRKNSLIDTLHTACENQDVAKLGACENNRDYTHTSEVAEGVLRLCNLDASTTVNLGSGGSLQLKEFVEKYWSEIGGDPELLGFAPPNNRPDEPNPFMDVSTLERLTNWKPTLSIEQGIEKTVADMNSFR